MWHKDQLETGIWTEPVGDTVYQNYIIFSFLTGICVMDEAHINKPAQSVPLYLPMDAFNEVA